MVPVRRARRRRASFFFVALAALAVAVPAPAAAVTVTGSAVLRVMRCDHGWHWQGGGYSMLGTQESGTFDYCVFLWQLGTADSSNRIQDGDPTRDTYIFGQTIDWAQTGTSGLTTNDSYAKVSVSSSIGALSGAYTAEPTTISSSACSPLSLSLGFAGAGIGVGPILCDNVTLKRDSLTYKTAQWSSTDVGRTPRWDVAYMLQVGQGQKPTFSALLTYPYYGRVVSGSYCGGGRCIPTYSFPQRWYTDPWTITAP